MYYKNNDIRIFYQKYGSGDKNIIILPGWGETRDTFTTMIDFLEEYATIYIVDYPGFGNSKFPNHDLTVYNYALIIDDFIKDLKINNPILIGHSFGGRIVILLNSYLNNNYNSILLDSAGIERKKGIKNRYRLYLYKLLKLRGKLKRKNKEKYLSKLRKRFGSTDYNSLPNKMRKTFINIVRCDLTKYLLSIKASTLLIWGEEDYDTPLKHGKLMNKLIKNSSLITIKKAGHFCYLNEPYLINKIIYSFIENV